MMRIGRFVVFGTAILLMACAGEQARQESMQRPVFDPNLFLSAQGEGQTEGGAKRDAMAALAAVFQSRVQAESEARAQSIILDQGDEQFEKQVRQMVRVHTDVKLEGARIGWVEANDSGDGYRALAVLDRRQAARRWGNELVRIAMELEAGQQGLETTKGRLPRLAALNHMAALMAQMAVIESRLSVLGRPSAPLDMDLSTLLAERARLRSEASILIDIEGTQSQTFAHRLAAGLSAQGLALSENMDQAAGLIKGKVGIQPLDLGDPQVFFVRALSDVEIVDLDTGVALAAFSETVRKGHVDESEAQRNALDKLAEMVVQKISQTLGTLGMATGK